MGVLLTGGHCAFTIRVYEKSYLPVALTEVSALRDVIQGQAGFLKRKGTGPAAQRRRRERRVGGRRHDRTAPAWQWQTHIGNIPSEISSISLGPERRRAYSSLYHSRNSVGMDTCYSDGHARRVPADF